jgi:hypothetical protein
MVLPEEDTAKQTITPRKVQYLKGLILSVPDSISAILSGNLYFSSEDADRKFYHTEKS